MNPKKTNYFFYLESFLGNNLYKLIPKIEEINKNYKLLDSLYYAQNFITNPLLRVLYQSSNINKSKIEFNILKLSGDNDDYVYLKFTGHLINYLKKEIEANSDFKKELKKKFLDKNSGPFFSVFCELLIGGFLKFSRCNVKFNSSKQTGKPDVVVTQPFKFANESKLFDDSEYWLIDKINQNRDVILKFLSSMENAYVIVMVTSMKKFSSELVDLFTRYLKTEKSQQGESLSIMKNTMYAGTQGYLIDYIPTHSVVRFIPSFMLRDDRIQAALDKATHQFKNDGLDGLVWLIYPHPKGGHIERILINQVSNIPQKYKEKGLGFVSYEFLPLSNVDTIRGGIQYALDIFTKKVELGFINQQNFGKFIEEIADKPTLYIP